MPSPQELVPIHEAAEHSGIAKRILENWATDGHLKAQLKRFFKKEYVAHVKPRGKLIRWFVWQDVLDCIARYKPGHTTREAMFEKLPEGYLIATDAARMLGIDILQVYADVTSGKLRGLKVPMNGIGKRTYTFVEKLHIEEIIEARTRTYDPGIAHHRPLISPDDGECLRTRRELWEKNNRVWPKNLVDVLRQAG